MSASNLSINSRCLYGDSKAAYFKLIASKEQTEIFDRKRYSVILNKLKLMSLQGAGTEQCSYVHDFEIFEDNGSLVLIKKRQDPNDPVLKCLPLEDSFDFLNTVHLSVGHGKPKEFREAALNNYAVDEMYVDYILQVCEFCSEISEAQNLEAPLKNKQLNKDVRIEIIFMGILFKPDGQFKFLLLYVDEGSSYTLLRPLVSRSALEVATELLNIFAGFGPPLRLHAPASEATFFKEVLINIQTFCPYSKMPDLITFKMNDSSYDLLTLFESWMEQTGHRNWGIACHLFQWYLNNTLTGIHVSRSHSIERTTKSQKKSPFQYVFKCFEETDLPLSLRAGKNYKRSKNSEKDKSDKDKEWYTKKPPSNLNHNITVLDCDDGVCSVCARPMLKSYTCINCLSDVHAFCCGIPEYSSSGDCRYVCFNCEKMLNDTCQGLS